MNYELPPDISFSRAGNRAVFLDVANDRYFQLSPQLEGSFLELVDDQQVSEENLARLITMGVLRKAEEPGRFEQVDIPVPDERCAFTGEISYIETARALFTEARIYHGLSNGQFSSIIGS